MALRRSVEVSLPTEWRISPRVLPACAFGIDALAMLAAAALGGLGWTTLAYGLVVLIALDVITPNSGRINPRLGDDIGWMLGRLGVSTLLVLPVAVLMGDPVKRLLVVGGAAAILVPLGRGLGYGLQRRAHAGGLVSERTLIVGTGELAVELTKILEERPEYGLRPIGLLGMNGHRTVPLPLLGEGRDLDDVVRQQQVTRVIVAFHGCADPELVTAIRRCERLPVQIHIVPRLFELSSVPAGPFVDDVWGIPLLRLRRPTLRVSGRVAKRTFDLVTATLILMLAIPVMVMAALAVKLSGPGPLLFRQRRVGANGQEYEILKFRSMRVNEDSDTRWAVTHDERVTPVGRLLRRTSIDELPQLFNVLRGEMSLVGPRPERPIFVNRFSASVARYGDRHRAPVGLTGWSQIHGLRGDTSIPHRARFDNRYIENWSLWLDVVIILRTIGLVFKGAGR